MHFAAHRHGMVIGQGVGHFRQFEAQQPAHRHGGQRGGQVVAPPDGHAEAHWRPVVSRNRRRQYGNSTGRTRLSMSIARTSHWLPVPTQVMPTGQSAATLRSQGSSPSTAWPSGRQGGQQLGLGAGDVAAVAEPGQMGVADVRDDADLSAGTARPARRSRRHDWPPARARHSRDTAPSPTCSRGRPSGC